MIIALDNFTAEELNLMSIFEPTSREALRDDLVTALHDVHEPDMIEIFGSVLEKLDSMTDDEFAKIGFYIADDDEDTDSEDEVSDVSVEP